MSAQHWPLLVVSVLCSQVPVDLPERFRVEILFSSGAAHDPFAVAPEDKPDHTLITAPREPMHIHNGVPLAKLQACPSHDVTQILPLPQNEGK